MLRAAAWPLRRWAWQCCAPVSVVRAFIRSRAVVYFRIKKKVECATARECGTPEHASVHANAARSAPSEHHSVGRCERWGRVDSVLRRRGLAGPARRLGDSGDAGGEAEPAAAGGAAAASRSGCADHSGCPAAAGAGARWSAGTRRTRGTCARSGSPSWSWSPGRAASAGPCRRRSSSARCR